MNILIFQIEDYFNKFTKDKLTLIDFFLPYEKLFVIYLVKGNGVITPYGSRLKKITPYG